MYTTEYPVDAKYRTNFDPLTGLLVLVDKVVIRGNPVWFWCKHVIIVNLKEEFDNIERQIVEWLTKHPELHDDTQRPLLIRNSITLVKRFYLSRSI